MHHSLSTKQNKTDCEVQQISESNFKKMNEAAEVRQAQGNESKGMSDICCQVPTEYISNLHGNYTWCYKNFMNNCRILKQNNPSGGGDVSSSKKARTANPSATRSLAVTQWQTSLCEKTLITKKQHVEKLVKCVTKVAEKSVKESSHNKTRSSHPFEDARYWLGCSTSTLPWLLSERLHSRGWQTPGNHQRH